jgi:hypothetical protein
MSGDTAAMLQAEITELRRELERTDDTGNPAADRLAARRRRPRELERGTQ